MQFAELKGYFRLRRRSAATASAISIEARVESFASIRDLRQIPGQQLGLLWITRKNRVFPLLFLPADCAPQRRLN